MSTNLKLNIDGKSSYIYTGARPFDASKPTVVFIHGTGMEHCVWVLPSRYFARHNINVLAVDLPGHGQSEGPTYDNIPDMADWVVKVLDSMGVQQSAVVGHSMGSLVAFDVARRYPDRVRSLGLVGSVLPLLVNDPLLDSSAIDSHDAIDMLTYWGYSRSAQMGGNETPGMWMVGGTVRLLERAAPGVINAGLRACNEFIIDTDNTPPLAVDTLLIQGDKDIMTPIRASQSLKSLLPNLRNTVLKGSGHSLMMERPDELLDALITIV